MTYQEAKASFAKARNKDRGKRLPGRLGSTSLISIECSCGKKRGEALCYTVKLHRTNVVEIHFNGSYLIRTGGWGTPTTHERISLYSPARPFGGASGRGERSFVSSGSLYFEITDVPVRITPKGQYIGLNVNYDEEVKIYRRERAKESRERAKAKALRLNPILASSAGRAIDGILGGSRAF